MKNRSYSSLRVVAALSVSAITFTHAAEQFWNPSPLSDDWANSVWSDTSGGGSLTTWTASNDAIFDQAGTYTATINADQTATNVNIKAGDVTFAGTNTAASNNLTIDAGASLTSDSDRFLKIGTTTLTVNGTLTQTAAVTNTGRRVSIAGGTGSIVLSGGLRTSGNFNFAGDISGSGSIITDAAGTFTLSGNNTFTGDMLIRHGNTIRVGSDSALSSNSFLRLGGGTNIIELTGANFSRTVGTSAGNVRFHAGADGAGNSGFAAVNADRTVEINGTVSWGAGLFNPTVFHLGTAASTHKVELTTGINLNAGTRTINTTNGSAAIEAEVSGALTNGTLLATGTGTLKLSGDNTLTTINKGAAGTDTGTLILSGSNTFSNSTLTFGTASQDRGAIRLENDNALGGVTVIAGNSGTGSARARIELANDVTISGVEYRAGGRTNADTTGAAIVNISGNNTWDGTIRITNTGGSYGIRSDAGSLEISGSLRNSLGTARTWELTGAGDILVSGTIVDGGASSLILNKTGAGTLEITGESNTYSGGTTLNAGTLLANNTAGSATGTGAVTVNGGTLGGTGTVSGAVAINTTGVLSPGASVGTLSTGALSLNTGSTFAYELNTTAITGDLLNVDGDLSFDGTVTLSLTDLGSNSLLALGSKFTLISYFGTWDGNTFSGFADDSEFTLLGNEWRIDYNDVSAGSLNGGTYSNAVTLTVIPEPTTAMLAGLGLLALLRRRR